MPHPHDLTEIEEVSAEYLESPTKPIKALGIGGTGLRDRVIAQMGEENFTRVYNFIKQ
jgi:hypothetical protein